MDRAALQIVGGGKMGEALLAGLLRSDAGRSIRVVETDAGRAEDGVAKLVETCGGTAEGDAEVGGWVVDGDWMVVAETEEIAQQVVDAARALEEQTDHLAQKARQFRTTPQQALRATPVEPRRAAGW